MAWLKEHEAGCGEGGEKPPGGGGGGGEGWTGLADINN